MRSKTANEIFEYWTRLCAGRPVPLRRDIQPAEMRTILADVFILQPSDDKTTTVRLAGTNICSLMGKELRNTAFENIWLSESRTALHRTITRTTAFKEPHLISATMLTKTERHFNVEVALLPLSSDGHVADRLIGTLVPLDLPSWLNTDDIQGLTIKSICPMTAERDAAHPESEEKAPAENVAVIRPAAMGNAIRRVLHLRVFEGGRQD